jgi:hypothetical protein
MSSTESITKSIHAHRPVPMNPQAINPARRSSTELTTPIWPVANFGCHIRISAARWSEAPAREVGPRVADQGGSGY